VVPDSVKMSGTIRTYDEKVREQVGHDVKLTAEKIAESAEAKAEVTITSMYAPTINDEALTDQMAPVIRRAADGKVAEAPLAGASEDCSFFMQKAPGIYFFLGVTPRDQDPAKAAPNHSPKFFVDESALVVGTRTMAMLALNFLNASPASQPATKARPFVQDEK
jgi:metal-dependent amidase/aminoacylase/carboxypeptidase family protein